MGLVQGDVSYVVHRLRPFPAPIADRYVADDALDDLGGDVLCPLSGTRDESYTELGFVQEAVQREGKLRG